MQSISVQLKTLTARLTHHGFKTLTVALGLTASAGITQAQTTMTSFADPVNQQQVLFTRGVDQHVYFRHYNPGPGWTIQDVTTLSGAPLTAPGTQITSFKDEPQNQQHVVFETANGHIYQAWSNSNPSSWQYQDITAITGSTSAAVATPVYSYVDNTYDVQYVFYVGVNGHIGVLYWYAGNWYAADASATAGSVNAAAGTKLAGYHDSNANLQHVMYEGTDQHIHDLYTGLDPAKVAGLDLTTASGGTLPSANPSLTAVFDSTKAQGNVFYVGQDQHIHHLSAPSASSVWTWEDVTAKGGGVVARSGGPMVAYLDPVAGVKRIFYIGASDLSLHQLSGATTWASENVTADASAVLPSLNSPLTAFNDPAQKDQHVFFIGLDGALYQVYGSTGWTPQNLTLGAVLPGTGN